METSLADEIAKYEDESDWSDYGSRDDDQGDPGGGDENSARSTATSGTSVSLPAPPFPLARLTVVARRAEQTATSVAPSPNDGALRLVVVRARENADKRVPAPPGFDDDLARDFDADFWHLLVADNADALSRLRARDMDALVGFLNTARDCPVLYNADARRVQLPPQLAPLYESIERGDRVALRAATVPRRGRRDIGVGDASAGLLISVTLGTVCAAAFAVARATTTFSRV